MRDAELDAVSGIIANVLGCRVEEVTADVRVGSLPQWDSINHMSIILAFEQHLARQLTSEEIGSLETVASFAALLASARDKAAT